VNIEHLKPKTQGENTKASALTVPAAHVAKTHCVNGHEFTPENTRTTARGWRVCRECKRAAYWRDRVPPPLRPCAECGQPIPLDLRRSAKFCGPECFRVFRLVHRPVLTVEAIA
jgi:hypothetical protein